MARKQRGLIDTMVYEVFRGTGRQTGRGISNLFQREIANRVYDPNSKFRKKMNNFTITSTVKGSLNKLYLIMDLFYEEYKQERTLFQKSFYCKSDIQKIDRKLLHTKHLIKTDIEQDDYDLCVEFWKSVKQEVSK
tara:strand:+ start:115 stop:519 length:405 start_codon:yes stop_codon:yes gene_type:complete